MISHCSVFTESGTIIPERANGRMTEPDSQDRSADITDLADAAAALGAAGFHVFPLHSIRDGACTCESRSCQHAGKHPRTSHGFYNATEDATTIAAFWTAWPDANIGVRTGGGLVVLDVDPRHGGDAELVRLENEHSPLPPTVIVATGGGGWHHYYVADADAPGSKWGKGGLELKADGGYVIAPPSIHVSGNRYQWGERDGLTHQPERVPAWLLKDAQRRRNGARQVTRTAHGLACPSRSPWRERIATGAPDGERHDTCTRLAGSLLGSGVPRDTVLEVMLGWARGCTPPYPTREVERDVQDIADREAAQHGPPVEFGPMSAQLADVPPEPEWLWHGLLAPGALTLLAPGQPKVGKSTLLFGLLGALEPGRPYLDRPTRATRALLLSEGRETTLAEKRAMFFADADPQLLMRHRMGAAEWPAVVGQARAHAREHGFGVLVVDTFLTWAGLRSGEENDAAAVLAAMEPLLAAASDGLAVLVVAHRRKAFGTHGEAVRGSNALTGAVDVILELERAPRALGPQVRELRAESRFAGTDAGFACELTEAGCYVARGPLGRLRAAAAEAELLELVARMPGAATAELADAADAERRTMARKLHVALDAGAHPPGRGRARHHAPVAPWTWQPGQHLGTCPGVQLSGALTPPARSAVRAAPPTTPRWRHDAHER